MLSFDDIDLLPMSLHYCGFISATFRTVPSTFRFVIQTDTVKVKPLYRTGIIITANHLSV